jgi:hypothetical protein
MKMSYSVLAALLLCSTTLVFADVYRWVDSQGRVQYSDQPPPGSNAKKVTNKPATGTQGSGAKSYQDQDQEFRKRRVEEEEAAKKQTTADQQAKTTQKNCAEAKSQLSLLQGGGRISKTNEKGEKEFLDEKGIESAIADARKAVADWCK